MGPGRAGGVEVRCVEGHVVGEAGGEGEDVGVGEDCWHGCSVARVVDVNGWVVESWMGVDVLGVDTGAGAGSWAAERMLLDRRVLLREQLISRVVFHQLSTWGYCWSQSRLLYWLLWE